MGVPAGRCKCVDIASVCGYHRSHINAWDVDPGEEFGEIGERIGHCNHDDTPCNGA
jgi:hypothetical protein